MLGHLLLAKVGKASHDLTWPVSEKKIGEALLFLMLVCQENIMKGRTDFSLAEKSLWLART